MLSGSLKSDMTNDEYKFVQKSYFMVRFSGKFWKEVWSNVNIEQTLMLSMESSEGLTYRQGVSENVLRQLILDATLEEFYRLSF